MVPAAMTALDFSRPDARPPDFFPAAGAGAGGGVEGGSAAGAGSGVGEGTLGGPPAGGVCAALLLVPEEMSEGVRLVALLAGLGHQVVDTHELGRTGVVAVRQVLGGTLRLGGRSLGPHARVGGVRGLGRLSVERGLRLVGAGRRRGTRGAVVEGLGDRVLGGEILRPVGILGVGILEVHVRCGLRRHLAGLRRALRRVVGVAGAARALTAVTVVRRVHGYPTSSSPGPPAATSLNGPLSHQCRTGP
ncbi:hypothetical protein QF035_005314 [Streptomyces umbrinus]|uniref:Uncharacterized protein n=1 Tax=Streptomyces umbrinus TaxID=67370 RepID=A0ABU0SW47_9ACTN|nr:hypothetical protein [Streptomyces umbrinus]